MKHTLAIVSALIWIACEPSSHRIDSDDQSAARAFATVRARSAPEIVTTLTAAVSDIKGDANGVYVADLDNVVTVIATGEPMPCDGAPSPTGIISDQFFPTHGTPRNLSLGVDAASLYYVADHDGDVSVIPKCLSYAAPGVIDLAGDLNRGLIVSAGYAHWLEIGDDGQVQIKRVASSGTDHKVVARGLSQPVSMAGDVYNLYFTDVAGETVYVAPLSGLHAKLFATGQKGLGAIASAADGQFVAWVTQGTQVHLASWVDGTVTVVAVGEDIGHVAIDSGNLYWVDASAGTISTRPLAGDGDGSVLVENESSISKLAFDSTSIYWANGDVLKRIPKPR